MMQKAVEMLIAQGHSGDRSKILMVGDRFDTDVRGGLSASVQTCLVESGCHKATMQRFYRTDAADYCARSVADLVPECPRDADNDRGGACTMSATADSRTH